MFRAIGFVIWTGLAIGFGAWMATAHVGTATPLEYASRVWEKTPLPEKIEDAKDALSSARDHQVRERHSDKDRDAVNKLIARH